MQNYTLVTGASTGIGRSIVEELIKENHIVFAGARKQSDLDLLKALGNQIIPLKLDVTKPEEIEKSLHQVSSYLKGDFSFHLVNNAGIVAPGPIEGLGLEQLRQQFEVNVFAVVAMTQAFLPLLRKGKGRIVMMSSISGITSTPFLGAYSASKFALEAISDSLRIELTSSGVQVFIIQPGPIATPIWEKNFSQEQDMLNRLQPQILNIYKNSLEKFKKTTKVNIKKAIPPKDVADAVIHCLKNDHVPVRQIIAAFPIRALMKVIKFLPRSLVDRQLKKAYLVS